MSSRTSDSSRRACETGETGERGGRGAPSERANGLRSLPFRPFSSPAVPPQSTDRVASVSSADLNSLKYHLEHYTLRYADGFSPPTSPQFPPLVHPRSYRPYIMTQSFTGGDGIEDGSLAALEGSEPALVSPLAGDNLGPSSSSSHPSRPSSPPLAGGAAFYTPYPQSQPIVAAPAPPRPASTETTSFPSHTPELELDHGSRASSINAASTTGTGKTIKVVQWTPQRGQEGTQVTIILDSAVIRFAAPSIHNPTSTPNFGDGSPSGSSPTGPVNRSFSVMFGQAVAPTEFTRAQAIDGNGVGHSMTAGPNEEDAFVVLTTFAPARNLMGGVGEPILVVVRVLDESGSTVESSIIGNWDAGAVRKFASHEILSCEIADRSVPFPAPSPTRLQSLKRAGDPLVNDRDGPGIPSESRARGHRFRARLTLFFFVFGRSESFAERKPKSTWRRVVCTFSRTSACDPGDSHLIVRSRRAARSTDGSPDAPTRRRANSVWRTTRTRAHVANLGTKDGRGRVVLPQGRPQTAG